MPARPVASANIIACWGSNTALELWAGCAVRAILSSIIAIHYMVDGGGRAGTEGNTQIAKIPGSAEVRIWSVANSMPITEVSIISATTFGLQSSR